MYIHNYVDYIRIIILYTYIVYTRGYNYCAYVINLVSKCTKFPVAICTYVYTCIYYIMY